MHALLPELEKFFSNIEIENGTDLVNIEIIQTGQPILKRLVMRRYAYALQTVANIIGIQVIVSESKN